ncbi:MAG TPA: glycosyltransferase family 92 protein [Vicinamibacterales bacterium]|nr:glycosyltransferase family 92 protein [Vicinamibacterales bacterium]
MTEPLGEYVSPPAEPRQKANKLFSLAVVAIVKDEGRCLEEWLAYHILLGCEHFYLFDNGSTDDSQKVLKKFITYGYVTRIDWPLFPGQIDAYNYAARTFGHLAEWLTFIDVDEFFVLKRHRSLPELLSTVDGDQLLIFWKMFGHSGHRQRPPGLVIENYTRCEPRLSPVTKTIVRTDRIRTVQVHNCVTTTGRTVNDLGAPLREDWMHPERDRSDESIRINHYFTRSYEEYEEKIRRGQVDGRTQKVLQPYEHFDYEDEDTTLADGAADVKDWLDSFRELRPQPHRYGPSTQVGSFSTPRNFMLYSQDVVQAALDAMTPATGRMDYHPFGRMASFDDVSIAPKLAAWMREQLPVWADVTNGEVQTALSDPSLPPFEFRNGSTSSSTGVIELQAVNGDPEIVATIHGPSSLAYHWLAAVVTVPQDTRAELFAFGVDAHGEDLVQARAIDVPRGLTLLMMMINDTPLHIRSGRLDPGSIAGRYDIWDVVFVRSR